MFSRLVLSGLLPASVLLPAVACLVVSAIGFYRLVFFISIGYGYSVAAMSILMLAGTGASAGWVTWAQAILLAFYGLRLGTYLVLRERNAAYRASQARDGDRSGLSRLGLKVVIWLSVSVLYVCMFMPMLARFASPVAGRGDPAPVLSLVGVGVMAAGVLIEAVADAQKRSAKKASPNRFCDVGLYRMVRCPNYFGELLVWSGNLLAGAALLAGWLEWAMALAGYLCIVLIMIGSARRLEIKQEDRYGSDPAFRRYATSVPVLLPLLPIYSVRNAWIYLS